MPTDANHGRNGPQMYHQSTNPIPGETVPSIPRQIEDATYTSDTREFDVFQVYDNENPEAWIECDSSATIDISE